MPRATSSARVAELAQLFDLTPYLDRKATRLTADAKQKISLGRGLVRSDVAAVLFDEPLTVIDPHMKWRLRSQLKLLHRQFGHTMVYVTHDQTEALTMSDRIAVFSAGRIEQLSTPRDLYERPNNVFLTGFVGSTTMNRCPADLAYGSVQFGSQVVPLDRDTVVAKRVALRRGHSVTVPRAYQCGAA